MIKVKFLSLLSSIKGANIPLGSYIKSSTMLNPGGNWAGSWRNADTYVSRGYLAITPSSASLLSRDIDISTDWLTQGEDRYGVMRDTNVNHAKSQGEIRLMTIKGATPPAPALMSEGMVYGSSFLAKPISHFRQWGESGTLCTETITRYSGEYVYTPKGFWESTRTSGVSLVFSGDLVAVVEFQAGFTEQWFSVSTGKEPVLEPGTTRTRGGSASVSFYRRNGLTSISKATATVTSVDAIRAKDPNKYSESFTSLQYTYSGQTYTTVDDLVAAVSRNTSVVWTLQSSYNTPNVGRADALVEWDETIAKRLSSFQSAVSNMDTEFEFHELTPSIFKQQKYVNVGLLVTLFQLPMMIDIWSKRTKVDLRQFLKTTVENRAANDYLATIYGIMPNISDAEAVLDGFKAVSEGNTSSRYHAREMSPIRLGKYHGQESYILTAEVAGLPTTLSMPMQLIRAWKQWGMYPSLEMFWDIVPFSFVLDWFYNVEQAAESADMHIDTQYFPVSYAMTTLKRKISASAKDLFPEWNASGVIDFVYYSRNITADLPLPPIQVSETVGSFTHWSEASALVVQQMR